MNARAILIRALRAGLIALADIDETPELFDVLDAWDTYEYAAGTAEGGEHEVIS